jgi:hypothetical protein
MKLHRFATPAVLILAALACGTRQSSAALLINELDSDTANTPSTDFAEFVELYDTSGTSVSLDGLSLIYINGNTDVTYYAVDLDGFSTSSTGYFVVGSIPSANIQANNPANPGGAPGNLLQNGQDAVVLYQGNAADFPNGTGLSSFVLANIVDAVTYDTGADTDGAGLDTALGITGGFADEFGRDGTGATGAIDSIGRFPNGSGAARNTTAWTFMLPSPGASNGGLVIPEPSSMVLAAGAALACCVVRRR